MAFASAWSTYGLVTPSGGRFRTRFRSPAGVPLNPSDHYHFVFHDDSSYLAALAVEFSAQMAAMRDGALVE